MSDKKHGWETPEWGTLWCCHVVGPDDVHAAHDFEDAIDLARQFNKQFASTPSSENAPILRGEVTLWPWDAESHKADLARRPKP